MNTFNGIFKQEMNDFLEQYDTLNHKIDTYIRVFRKLDDLLCEYHTTEKKLSRELVYRLEKSFNVRPYTFYTYMSDYRNFAKYLNNLGYEAYIPELSKKQSDYTPYIFSDDEWRRIIDAADNIKIRACPLYSLQMPVLVRMLYGCGMRVSEALNLRVRDIDLETGILTLLQTKNQKQRQVPMDTSLISILRSYLVIRNLCHDDWVFHCQNHTQWNLSSVDNCFKHILKTAEIFFSQTKAYDRGPCLHCLRHTFVLNSLKQSARCGRSFEDTIPFISTYLGHDSIYETDKYLNFNYELYEDAVDLIEDYTHNLFPEVKQK